MCTAVVVATRQLLLLMLLMMMMMMVGMMTFMPAVTAVMPSICLPQCMGEGGQRADLEARLRTAAIQRFKPLRASRLAQADAQAAQLLSHGRCFNWFVDFGGCEGLLRCADAAQVRALSAQPFMPCDSLIALYTPEAVINDLKGLHPTARSTASKHYKRCHKSMCVLWIADSSLPSARPTCPDQVGWRWRLFWLPSL